MVKECAIVGGGVVGGRRVVRSLAGGLAVFVSSPGQQPGLAWTFELFAFASPQPASWS